MACICYLTNLEDFKNYALFQIFFRAAMVLFMIIPFGLYTLFMDEIGTVELYYVITGCLLCFTFWLSWVFWISFAFKIDYPTEKNERWLQEGGLQMRENDVKLR